jgi:Domain of unknown function (DUF4159)
MAGIVVQDWRYLVTYDERSDRLAGRTCMSGRSWKLLSVIIAAGSVVVLAGAARAQGRRWFPMGDPENAQTQRVAYDGRFTFARLRFETAPGGYYYRGLPAWAHGYPAAERNLMHIADDISLLRAHIDESNVFNLDDPDLDEFPVAYMTEAGFWTLNDKEAAAFGAYLRKGGFVIFDDFRDDQFRGGGGWDLFESNMRRVIPEGKFVDLDPSHPIFHAFFEIDSFDIIPQDYDRARPILRGLFENNDPNRRLMAIANFNTDVSNFWEFSGTGFRPVSESNEAYKLGVNYVIYGMTH